MKDKTVAVENYFIFENYPPEKQARFKFVIIETYDALYFVFGPLDPFGYHANLVGRFATEHEIPSHWLEKPHLVEILDVAYKVNGGGWVDLNPKTKMIMFYGYSTAYGEFDHQQLLYIIEKSGLFADWEVVIN